VGKGQEEVLPSAKLEQWPYNLKKRVTTSKGGDFHAEAAQAAYWGAEFCQAENKRLYLRG
jgi:hypothetical protein